MSAPGVLPGGRTEQTGRIVVVAESTGCLPAELVRRYGIGIVPIPFVFGDETFRDGVDLSTAQFYEKLVSTRTPPKTSPPSPGEYLQAWRDAASGASGASSAAGADGAAGALGVVLVTVDSTVSTLQRSARLAQQLAAETLPNISVAVVDSLSAGMGQGFVALAAARAAQAGDGFDAVVAHATAVSRRVKMIVTLDTLEYLARASRIPQVAAFVGGMLSIKPIIQLSGGDLRLLTRVRTRRRSIEALLDQMRRAVPAGARLHVAVQHARAVEEAGHLAERVRAEFDPLEIFTTEFTPVMGGYCGPGLLGLAFYAEDVGDG